MLTVALVLTLLAVWLVASVAFALLAGGMIRQRETHDTPILQAAAVPST